MNPYTLYTDIKTAITVAVDKGAGSNKQSAVTTRTSYHCHDPKSTQEAQSSRGFPPPCVYLSSKELKKKKFCLVCMNTNTSKELVYECNGRKLIVLLLFMLSKCHR